MRSAPAEVFQGASGSEELGLFREPWASVGRRLLEQVARDLIWKNAFFSVNESSFTDWFAFVEASYCSLFSLLSCVRLCAPVVCSTPGLLVHHQLPELAQTHVHWVSDAIQPSCPLSSPSPPVSIFPSIRVFSNESALRIRWQKYWNFSFSNNPVQ